MFNSEVQFKAQGKLTGCLRLKPGHKIGNLLQRITNIVAQIQG